jgi:hypothetical protein
MTTIGKELRKCTRLLTKLSIDGNRICPVSATTTLNTLIALKLEEGGMSTFIQLHQSFEKYY